MQTDSSASRTYFASESASEWTATVLTPSSRHARWIRNAISPRLAIRIFSNTVGSPGGCCQIKAARRTSDERRKCTVLATRTTLSRAGSNDQKQRLTILHRLTVLDIHLFYLSALVRFDFVQQLHGFDDA